MEQSHLQVLNRPLVLSGRSDLYHWTKYYLDAGGLGMTMTISLPVFNKSTESNNQTLLGVAGVDVPIIYLQDLLSSPSLIPLGYLFAIDGNGLVLFHPKLPMQTGYLEEPLDIDLYQLEGNETTKLLLRRRMIDREKGDMMINSLVIVDDNHIGELKYHYYYSPVINTSITLGLAVPKNFHMLTFDDLPTLQVQMAYSLNNTLINFKNLCSKGNFSSINTSFEIISYAIHNASAKCNVQVVQHLLWDSYKSLKLFRIWNNSHSKNYYNRFVLTSGGLIRTYPIDETRHFQNQTNPLQSNLFLHASLSDNIVFRAAIRKQYFHNDSTTKEVPSIIMLTNVKVGKGLRQSIVAVGGAQVKYSYFRLEWMKLLNSDIPGSVTCADSESLWCYILDDGAIIVATNRDDSYIGTRLGTVDYYVMDYLIANKFYQRQNDYIFNPKCTRPYPLFSSSHPIPGLYWFPSLVLGYLKSVIITLYWNIVNYLLIWPAYNTLPVTHGHYHSPRKSQLRNMYPCIQTNVRFHFAAKTHTLTNFSCSLFCTRKMFAAKLESTNLLFLVAQPSCICNMDGFNPAMSPVEDLGPSICNAPSFYRKRNYECLSSHLKEDDSVCTSCSGTPGITQIIFITATIMKVTL